MTKLIVVFRNFGKESKNKYERSCQNISDASGENFSESRPVNCLLEAVHTPRHQPGRYVTAIDADRLPRVLTLQCIALYPPTSCFRINFMVSD
jgi:hypothetical protein